MKAQYFLALATLFAVSATAQNSKLIPTPPNCVSIKGDFLWMSTTEVSNFQWLEYLYDLKQNGEVEAHAAAMPDTLVWRQQLAYNEPYVEYYFRHPAYRNYPVVGVSHTQANDYCKWLTHKLNELMASTDEAVAEVCVRLPTEQEWMAAARGNQPETAIFPWPGTTTASTLRKYSGSLLANYKPGRGTYLGIPGRLNDNADVCAPVQSYWPNDFGLYNMVGNVAEWMTEPGVTKGGSWSTTGWYLQIDVDDDRPNTGQPADDIGFRYVVDIVRLRNDLVRKKKDELNLTAKFIESSTVYVGDSLYAGTTEVSNQLYATFISDLAQTNPSAAQQHRQQDELWANASPYPIFQNHSFDPRRDNHPAVNMTYESAQAFCDWLTATYSAQPKRKFSKVIFRLPTEAEWTRAARAGTDYAYYPWGGPYARNARGCYLANFNPQEARFQRQDTSGAAYYDYPNDDPSISRTLDGGDLTVAVRSYHPNDFGLYNCSGNIAEMVAEKGICKGGSWASTEPSIQIETQEIYHGPAPTVGFRYVMQILQE